MHVCKLKKVLYDLKHAPRAWYTELTKFLLSFRFSNSLSDSSLFIYHQSSTTIYLLVYVDDIVVTRNKPSKLHWFISSLSLYKTWVTYTSFLALK